MSENFEKSKIIMTLDVINENEKRRKEFNRLLKEAKETIRSATMAFTSIDSSIHDASVEYNILKMIIDDPHYTPLIDNHLREGCIAQSLYHMHKHNSILSEKFESSQHAIEKIEKYLSALNK